MDLQKLTATYLKIRDARTELTKKFTEEEKALKDKEDTIKGFMAKVLQDQNVDSMRTEKGTFYRQTDITPTGADWDLFYEWIVKNDAFDALEKRIKKTFIAEYMEANKGAIPPGVNVFREYVIRVRRA